MNWLGLGRTISIVRTKDNESFTAKNMVREACTDEAHHWRIEPAINNRDAINIIPVAIHPTIRRWAGRRNWPTTVGCVDSSMVRNIKGPATIPLATADQNNARIGLIPEKFRP